MRESAELFLAHAEAEERLLFPVLRRFAPGGWAVVADQDGLPLARTSALQVAAAL